MVTNKNWTGLLLPTAAVAIMAACGGGSTFNVQNPPPPSITAVTIAFQPVPPNSLLIGATVQVTAAVQNDSSKAGVDWTLSCQPAGNCGSLSSSHTSSGQPVTYSPPPTLSGNNQVVDIVAFATADHSKNVVGPITVTAFGSVLAGNYVMGTSGSDFSSGLPFQQAGVIVLDGNGGITAGEQTVNFDDPNTGLLSSVTDPITGGSYFVGTDGRGELIVKTNDTNIGQNGIETFSLVVLSSSHVLLTKLDDVNFPGSSNETSSGTLDLQTTAPAPALGYAFVANGADINGSAMAVGGVLNIDSPMTISGAGSAFDLANPNTLGTGIVAPSSAVSGTVTSADALGAYQIAVATDFANPVQFTVYPIDANHAKLIESDGTFGFTIGDAYSQGAQTGKYKGKGRFTGNYAFGIFGRDFNGGTASLAGAGLFSTTGVGTLTNGFLDESQAGTLVQIDDKFTAAYAVGPGSDPTVTTDPAGTGRYYIPLSGQTGFPKFTFATHANGTGPAWVFYMTTTGGPALMLDADTEPALASGLFGGGVGTGIAYPIVAKSPFSGSYGTIFTQNVFGGATDVVGELTANSNTLTGVLDFSNGIVDDNSLTGTFQTGPVANRLGGTMSDNFFTNALGTTSLRMVFYPIDSTQGFLVEHDLANSAGVPISGDLSFGHYFARTPVCQGCP
jgi:hypothetical protein